MDFYNRWYNFIFYFRLENQMTLKDFIIILAVWLAGAAVLAGVNFLIKRYG